MAEYSEQDIQTLREAGAAVVSDVFDSLGLTPLSLHIDLRPVSRPLAPFAGPAYTIAGESFKWKGGAGDKVKLAAIDNITPGVVPVWAGGDIQGVCCFGDLLAEAMKARGAAGVVVDGGVRDVGYLENMGLPMLARYNTPTQSIGRWRVVASQVTVRIQGAVTPWVDVSPGDVVVADGDGAVVVPQKLVAGFAEKAKAWAQKDGDARRDIKAGALLLDTLDKYGHL